MGDKSEAKEREMLCPKSVGARLPPKSLILLFSFQLFLGYFIPSTKFQIDDIFKAF